ELQMVRRAKISVPFAVASLDEHKARQEDLALSYYSMTRGWLNVEATTSDGYLYAYVDHFSQWAITVTPPETRPSTVPNVLTEGLSEYQTGERWYQWSWLGDFSDAGSGWVYHADHGWLYPAEDGSGNYWLYHANLGWLWSGPDFYGNAQDQTFLYSNNLGAWLHYDAEEDNFHVYLGAGYKINHEGVTPAPSGSGNYSDGTVLTGTGWGYAP
ncbi:uncharacterized protein METZ01_LOCUS493203, partial [marine metagenome]